MSRVATLATEIRTLMSSLIEHERDASGVVEEIVIERAAFTRARLDIALRCYFMESEAKRANDCPVHGTALLVTCPECAERCPAMRPHHEAYRAELARSEAEDLAADMSATLAAVEEGRTFAVEPRHTLRILEASRRTA